MSDNFPTRALVSIGLALVCLTVLPLTSNAQSPQFAPRRVIVAPPPASGVGMMGSFYPDRYLYYGGDVNPNSGYFPLGMYGGNTMSLDGPLSNYRSTSAPVLTYTRGYDGAYRPSMATSFSYPNLPVLSPVVYPTRSNFFYGPRQSKLPQWQRATNWIDQN